MSDDEIGGDRLQPFESPLDFQAHESDTEAPFVTPATVMDFPPSDAIDVPPSKKGTAMDPPPSREDLTVGTPSREDLTVGSKPSRENLTVGSTPSREVTWMDPSREVTWVEPPSSREDLTAGASSTADLSVPSREDLAAPSTEDLTTISGEPSRKNVPAMAGAPRGAIPIDVALRGGPPEGARVQPQGSAPISIIAPELQALGSELTRASTATPSVFDLYKQSFDLTGGILRLSGAAGMVDPNRARVSRSRSRSGSGSTGGGTPPASSSTPSYLSMVNSALWNTTSYLYAGADTKALASSPPRILRHFSSQAGPEGGTSATDVPGGPSSTVSVPPAPEATQDNFAPWVWREWEVAREDIEQHDAVAVAKYTVAMEHTDRPHVLVAGPRGAGKSELINAVLQRSDAATGCGAPVTKWFSAYGLDDEEAPVVMFDCKGLEHGAHEEFVSAMQQFLGDRAFNLDFPANCVHVVWYVINLAETRIDDFTFHLWNTLYCDKHIVCVLNKADLVPQDVTDAMVERVKEYGATQCADVVVTVARPIERKEELVRNVEGCPKCHSIRTIVDVEDGVVICKDCHEETDIRLHTHLDTLVRVTKQAVPVVIWKALKKDYTAELDVLDATAREMIDQRVNATRLRNKDNTLELLRELGDVYSMRASVARMREHVASRDVHEDYGGVVSLLVGIFSHTLAQVELCCVGVTLSVVLREELLGLYDMPRKDKGGSKDASEGMETPPNRAPGPTGSLTRFAVLLQTAREKAEAGGVDACLAWGFPRVTRAPADPASTGGDVSVDGCVTASADSEAGSGGGGGGGDGGGDGDGDDGGGGATAVVDSGEDVKGAGDGVAGVSGGGGGGFAGFGAWW